MSYAGPASRAKSSPSGSSASRRPAKAPSQGTASSRGAGTRNRPAPAPGHPPIDDEGSSWQQLAIFGTGLAIGIALGAGVALLTAPRTGAEARATLRANVSRVRRSTTRRGRDAWDDLRDELRKTAHSLRRRQVSEELAREAEL